MEIVFHFLELLKLRFNKRTVRNYFIAIDGALSLVTLSNLFDEFKVDNAAVQISEENFHLISPPFIAKTHSINGDYCLVTKIEESLVYYEAEKGRAMVDKLEQFLKQYSGIVLVAEVNQSSGEPNYLLTRRQFRNEKLNIVVTILILTFFATFNLIRSDLPKDIFILFSIKIIGLFVVVLLLMKSYGLNNSIANNFCSTSTGDSCDNLLTSSSSKLFGGILSWSLVLVVSEREDTPVAARHE